MNDVIAAGVRTGKRGDMGAAKRLDKERGSACIYTSCKL